MYKIEITAETLAELAGKAASLAAKLNTGAGTEAPVQLRITAAGDLVREVAEAAPVDPTPSSPPATGTSTTQSSEPAPKSAAAAEATDNQPTTPEPSSTPAPAASACELDFDADVAPFVLQVVKEKGKPVAQEILSQFGVEKASSLDPAQWPELVATLKAAL